MDILKDVSKIPAICWENQKGEYPIKFDGIPYIWLGSCEYQCHQGKDKNVIIKQKYRLKQQEKLCSDHPEAVQTRKLAQPSKKVRNHSYIYAR